MIVNIDKVLEQKQLSRYWLANAVGYRYQTIVNLCNNNTSSISFDLAEKICNALNCTMSDIFLIQK